MTDYPEFQVDPNAVIYVDFDDEGGHLMRTARRTGSEEEKAKAEQEAAAKSIQALQAVTNAINHMARRVTASVKNLNPADKPTKVEVEFGLKLDTEAGVFVAKAGMEATINVTLTWVRKDAAQAAPEGSDNG